jgi:proteasome lid subunit RPN8/RPN11
MAQATFKVHITPFALTKLNEYARAALPNEIGGLARIQSLDNGDVIVTDVKMFEQEASGVTFELSDDALTKFMQEMVKAGRAEELSEWCSIVHSHPEGMSAHMSGVDVSAIKRYAAEQDAFSLIISASRKADTQPGDANLLMHYCCNGRAGGKIIVSDIPVHMATTQDRLALANDVAKFVRERLGQMDDADLADIDNAAHVFATDLIPGLWKADREKLRAEADEQVPKLIKTKARTFGPVGGRSISHHSAYGYGYPSGSYSSWLDDDDDFLGAPTAPASGDSLTFEMTLDEALMSGAPESMRDKLDIDRYESLLMQANGFDNSGVRISEKKREKAVRKLRGMARQHGINIVEDIEEIGDDADFLRVDLKVGDYVVTTREATDRVGDSINDIDMWHRLENLETTPGKISSIVSGPKGTRYRVDGFEFYANELLYDGVSAIKQEESA